MSHSFATAAPIKPGCLACANSLEPGAKFCGTCGTPTQIGTHGHQALAILSKPPNKVPGFAPIVPRPVPGAIQEFQQELGKIIVLLARERLFLYFHWLTFLALNASGVVISFKCYFGYLGDELTRLMMASTPLLYVNCLALLCIVPIRGTRKEIARLKERLNFVKFQIEYFHLLK
ncbi:MAG: hypothetical protein HY711_00010 [Candidatus Melainabacteria bacterium]|nr:hypothetical protein [Candidatus Melainabacteria bacterium]